jgi:hypothetical protein
MIRHRQAVREPAPSDLSGRYVNRSAQSGWSLKAATRASTVADSIAVRYKRQGKFIHLRGKQLRTAGLLAEDSVHDLGTAGTI